MKTNLQAFWTAQQASGVPASIFLSEEEANQAINAWNEQLDIQLERWLDGDRSVSDSLINSQLESDCSGGCYQSYHINPTFRPSGYLEIPKGKAVSTDWADAPGYNRVCWINKPVKPVKKAQRKAPAVNPVFARAVKPS